MFFFVEIGIAVIFILILTHLALLALIRKGFLELLQNRSMTQSFFCGADYAHDRDRLLTSGLIGVFPGTGIEGKEPITPRAKPVANPFTNPFVKFCETCRFLSDLPRVEWTTRLPEAINCNEMIPGLQ